MEDYQFLNTNKTKRKKFINEFFTFNRKNIKNINKEFSYDFSANNNIDSYSFFKENSFLISKKKNKNKLNTLNITNKTTESKNLKDSYYVNKEIFDYKIKNKEKELTKNIKKIKVIK